MLRFDVYRLGTLWFFLGAITLTPGTGRAGEPPPAFVEHWAPVIYHDIAGNYRDDYLTHFDFDGDWDATNNQESLESGLYPLNAAVYYAVIETETHIYLTYAFFHPYDASIFKPTLDPALCLLHENDMEGAILTIRKDGSPFGALRTMATEAHGQVYYFKLAGSDVGIGSAYYDNAGAGPDTTVYFPGSGGKPAVFIEADGHGVGSQFRAMGPASPGIVTLGGVEYVFQNNDGVIYYHDGGPPEEPTGTANESVRYELRPLEEFWSRRHNSNGELPYCNFVNFVGNRGCTLENLAVSFRGSCWWSGQCAANPPWGWASDAPGSPTGEWFLDPAHVTGFLHLQDLPERTLPGFDTYVCNPYLQGDTDLKLLAPADGAQWTLGSQEWIQWSHSDVGQGPTLAGSVDVELSRDGGPWEALVSGVPIGDGGYLWTVTGPGTGDCRMRITAPTDCVLSISDEAGVALLPAVGVPDAGPLARVYPGRPNPFRSTVTVSFDLERAASVRLRIYDPAGRPVRTLLPGVLHEPGAYSYLWDGRDKRGQDVPPGAYVYRLEIGDSVNGGKIIRVQ